MVAGFVTSAAAPGKISVVVVEAAGVVDVTKLSCSPTLPPQARREL